MSELTQENGSTTGEQTPKIDVSRFLEFGPITNPGRHLEIIQATVSPNPKYAGLQALNLYTHPFLFEHPEMYQVPIPKLPEGAPAREDFPDFPSAEKMIDMLFERGPKDLTTRRKDKLQTLRVSCAPISYLLASFLKSHDIPARVRAGFADYFPGAKARYIDHWLTEYWNGDRWVQSDVDAAFSLNDWHDLPKGKFMTGEEAWLKIRSGEIGSQDFSHEAYGLGIRAAGIQMAYDIGNIMMQEPVYGMKPHDLETEEDSVRLFSDSAKMELLDQTARLLNDPDKNMDALNRVWEQNPAIHPQRS